MMRLPSIRVRLSRALLIGSLMWSLAVSAAVWLVIQHEVQELLDDAQRASAELLAGQLAGHEARTGSLASWPMQDATAGLGTTLAWQVVAHLPDGPRVLLASPQAPRPPFLAAPTAGFTDGADWRIYGIALGSQARMLYFAQTEAERQEAGFEPALSAGLAAMALSMLAHIWLRARAGSELAPLQRLATRLDGHDPLAAGATLGDAERAELLPVHRAIDGLSERLARRVASERAFTAHAAHALRTPLAGIDAQLAVAQREAPPALQGRLQRVRVAAGRLQRVVTALLTLFRSGMELHPVPVDLASLVQRLPLDGLAVDVHATHAVQADADLLAAALINLLDNALRHGATQVLLSTPAPATVRIEDDGPGITNERRAMLQAALDAQSYEGRTGLGLMLADMIARSHGGTLTLQPGPRGLTVDLALSAGADARARPPYNSTSA